jgi:hypothetical protein
LCVVVGWHSQVVACVPHGAGRIAMLALPSRTLGNSSPELETMHKDDLPATNAAEHKLLYLGFYSPKTDSAEGYRVVGA